MTKIEKLNENRNQMRILTKLELVHLQNFDLI